MIAACAMIPRMDWRSGIGLDSNKKICEEIGPGSLIFGRWRIDIEIRFNRRNHLYFDNAGLAEGQCFDNAATDRFAQIVKQQCDRNTIGPFPGGVDHAALKEPLNTLDLLAHKFRGQRIALCGFRIKAKQKKVLHRAIIETNRATPSS